MRINDPQLYFIQGFFFQPGYPMFSIVHRGESEGGVGVVMQEGTIKSMFSGIIAPHQLNPKKLAGEMHDAFGVSDLSDIIVSDQIMTFWKKYRKRPDLILYSFQKKSDGSWEGHFDGDATGRGKATCMLIPVPEKIFFPPA